MPIRDLTCKGCGYRFDFLEHPGWTARCKVCGSMNMKSKFAVPFSPGGRKSPPKEEIPCEPKAECSCAVGGGGALFRDADVSIENIRMHDNFGAGLVLDNSRLAGHGLVSERNPIGIDAYGGSQIDITGLQVSG